MSSSPDAPAARLEGKVCLVTGATSGIGQVMSRVLAERGATLIAAGRDAGRTGALVDEIHARVPAAAVIGLVHDLAEVDGVRALAKAASAAAPGGIDVLLNNAGAVYARRQETAEGVERTFALNVVAPFLLTLLLRDRLNARAPSRVVMVASEAHRMGRLDLTDLEFRHGYSGMRAYNASKLALMLLTRELARRFAPDGIRVNAVHPGLVRTHWGLNNRGWFGGGVRLAQALFGISAEAGARTPLAVACDAAFADVTGAYVVRGRIRPGAPASNSPEMAARLWTTLSERVGLGRSGAP